MSRESLDKVLRWFALVWGLGTLILVAAELTPFLKLAYAQHKVAP